MLRPRPGRRELRRRADGAMGANRACRRDTLLPPRGTAARLRARSPRHDAPSRRNRVHHRRQRQRQDHPGQTGHRSVHPGQRRDRVDGAAITVTTARATGSCSPWCSTTWCSSRACGESAPRTWTSAPGLPAAARIGPGGDGDQRRFLHYQSVAGPAQAAGAVHGLSGRSADLRVRRMGGRSGSVVSERSSISGCCRN